MSGSSGGCGTTTATGCGAATTKTAGAGAEATAGACHFFLWKQPQCASAGEIIEGGETAMRNPNAANAARECLISFIVRTFCSFVAAKGCERTGLCTVSAKTRHLPKSSEGIGN